MKNKTHNRLAFAVLAFTILSQVNIGVEKSKKKSLLHPIVYTNTNQPPKKPVKPIALGQFTPLPAATPYIELILKGAEDYDLDPSLILAVMQNESSFRPEVESHAGAVGLMQLLPATASWVTKVPTTSEDLKNPSVNINAGCAYLAYIKSRIKHHPVSKHTTLILAGYNSGHARVLGGTVPNFKETKNYVKKCLTTIDELA